MGKKTVWQRKPPKNRSIACLTGKRNDKHNFALFLRRHHRLYFPDQSLPNQCTGLHSNFAFCAS
jgi:hypothetical protein